MRAKQSSKSVARLHNSYIADKHTKNDRSGANTTVKKENETAKRCKYIIALCCTIVKKGKRV